MYASWARASRSAALRASKARLATHPGRHFHASAPVRAATDANNANNASQDGDDKPKDGDANGISQESTKDENLFGEKGVNSNGDTRGRQRRSIGLPKSRATRHRTPEELPPIQLPADFVQNHIYRYGDVRKDEHKLQSSDSAASDPQSAASFLNQLEELRQRGPVQTDILDRMLKDTFDAAAWDEAELQKFRDNISLDSIETASQRGSVMLMAAWTSLLNVVPTLMADSPVKLEEFTKELQQVRDVRRGQLQKDHMKIQEMGSYFVERILPYDPASEDSSSMLKSILRSKIRFHRRAGIVHHDALLEAAASIRADFAINPPKNVKAAELKRPVTVLNFPYYSGFVWPKYAMQDIAMELGADMVHLTAQDIANVAGPYLGQDTIRAPGPLSVLGYKAAENAGRIRQRAVPKSDEDIRSDFLSIVIPGERPKKEGKKKLSIMDYVLGEPSRGKTDEMWVDLKINAVLEELIHAADVDSTEPRPLIVHIHDFNALNMDEECGAIILGKLRKIIDELWIEGKKVVLVGTCSSLDTPKIYQKALKDLNSSERLITLNTQPYKSDETPLTDAAPIATGGRHGSKPFMKRLKEIARIEYLDENAKNIVTMLKTLLDIGPDDSSYRIDFSLSAMDERHRSPMLSQKILPLSEVYRVAKTMIGLRRQDPEVFDQAVFEESVRLIKNVDAENDRLHSSLDKIDSEIRRNLMDERDNRSTDYEKKFLSSLVNPDDLKTTFNDIHAPQETIESIKMLTQLSLLRPEAFAYGVLATDRIPGCLLYGPPGTGKTLLAKAVAKESGANMIEVSGASINQMYVGESEKNIKALFSLAKKKEPLVIFIDEADALLGARGGRNDAAGRRDVINQFLREWDGMETSKAFIMVATNRPFDLDEAVLRRLPRKLLIDLPLEADRAAILKIHLKNEALDDTVSVEEMAKQTALYSGSDLKNVCVAAAMAAVKEELEASEKHTGPEPYVWPQKRILNRRHFDKALSEIPASVSEDMATLNAIKKFDERYGEKKVRRKRRGMGFEVVPEATDSHEARVRNPGK